MDQIEDHETGCKIKDGPLKEKGNNSKTGPLGTSLFLILTNETGWYTWRESLGSVICISAGRADCSGGWRLCPDWPSPKERRQWWPMVLKFSWL